MKKAAPLSRVLAALAFTILVVTGFSVPALAEQHATDCSHSWAVAEVYKKASTSSYGHAKFSCRKCGEYETRTIPMIYSIKPASARYTFRAKKISAKINIKDSYGNAVPQKYYTVTYSNNKFVGTAKAKITFNTLYTGTSTVTFSIVPKAPTIKSISTSESKYTLKWTKVSKATGYQISASTSKKFDLTFNTLIKSGTTASKTVTVPTGGIKYFVRVRSYKVVNNKKYYSNWSPYKTITVQEKSWSKMSEREQVVSLVNKERKKVGSRPLVLNNKITKAANKRATEISSYFSHTRPDGRDCFTALREYGVKYSYAGENIAAGQRNADSVMYAWMHSPGHKSNILNSNYGRIGVGYYLSSSGYRYHWVQLFTD